MSFLDTPPAQIDCRPHRWHVVEMGEGPGTLMLHGAGSSALSFRRMADRLEGERRLLIPDLPGHGRTRLGTRQRSGLQPMAEDVGRLAQDRLDRIDLVIAHSAGAAVALEMARHMDVGRIVAINPALRPFDGVAGWLFPMLAKALAINPLAPQILARMTGNTRRIRDLLKAQGSAVDDEMIAHYRALASDPRHVAGTLAMMGQWSVDPLRRALPGIATPVLFLAGANDQTVPPEVSEEAAGMMPNAEVVVMDGLGHLAHEEDPDRVVHAIRDFAPVRVTT